MKTLHNEIREFIVENFLFGQDDNTPGDNESFLESGIIDSTGVLELVGFLEKRFRFSVEDSELVPANLDSIERLVRFIDRKQQLKGTASAG